MRDPAREPARAGPRRAPSEAAPEDDPAAPAHDAPAGPASRGWLARLRDRDHTRGSLLTSIAVLSAPSVLTSLFGGGLFQLVELRMLGRIGPEALAIAGATNQTLRQAFFLVVFGVSVACQMLIARAVGEGRVDEAEHVAGQTFVLAIGLSIAIALCGLLFAEPLVALVVPPELVPMGAGYTRIALALMASGILVQMFAAVLSGAGDATTPLFVTLAVTPVAIALQWTFAFGGLGLQPLGLEGIALGAGLGGLVGVAISWWAIASGRVRVHLRWHHLRPDLAAQRRLASVSWQPALHMLARTTIIFFFMVLAGSLGGKVQAAYTIGLRIEMIAFMVAFPVANACATLVSQNLGARDVGRAWRAIRWGMGVELSLLLPFALFVFLSRHWLVGLFTDDPEVATLAAEYLLFASIQSSFYGIYFIAFRSLQAAGDMMAPMVISVVIALGLGVPLGWALATQSDLGATGMWIANLTYGLTNTLVMTSWLLLGRWSRRVGVRP